MICLRIIMNAQPAPPSMRNGFQTKADKHQDAKPIRLIARMTQAHPSTPGVALTGKQIIQEISP